MEFRPRRRRSLSGGTYSDLTVKGDFRCGLAMQVACRDVRFEECRMEQINFSGSKFDNCHFVGCNLSGANFNATTFHGSSFSDCTLDMAGFRAAALWGTNVIGGRAEYASFEEALLRDCILDTQLHGADLRFASARGLDMGDSNLWAASVNTSCRNFRDVRYSDRAVRLFLALLSKTAGNDELRGQIAQLVDSTTTTVMERLTEEEVEA